MAGGEPEDEEAAGEAMMVDVSTLQKILNGIEELKTQYNELQAQVTKDKGASPGQGQEAVQQPGEEGEDNAMVDPRPNTVQQRTDGVAPSDGGRRQPVPMQVQAEARTVTSRPQIPTGNLKGRMDGLEIKFLGTLQGSLVSRTFVESSWDGEASSWYDYVYMVVRRLTDVYAPIECITFDDHMESLMDVSWNSLSTRNGLYKMIWTLMLRETKGKVFDKVSRGVQGRDKRTYMRELLFCYQKPFAKAEQAARNALQCYECKDKDASMCIEDMENFARGACKGDVEEAFKMVGNKIVEITTISWTDYMRSTMQVDIEKWEGSERDTLAYRDLVQAFSTLHDHILQTEQVTTARARATTVKTFKTIVEKDALITARVNNVDGQMRCWYCNELGHRSGECNTLREDILNNRVRKGYKVENVRGKNGYLWRQHNEKTASGDRNSGDRNSGDRNKKDWRSGTGTNPKQVNHVESVDGEKSEGNVSLNSVNVTSFSTEAMKGCVDVNSLSSYDCVNASDVVGSAQVDALMKYLGLWDSGAQTGVVPHVECLHASTVVPTAGETRLSDTFAVKGGWSGIASVELDIVDAQGRPGTKTITFPARTVPGRKSDTYILPGMRFLIEEGIKLDYKENHSVLTFNDGSVCMGTAVTGSESLPYFYATQSEEFFRIEGLWGDDVKDISALVGVTVAQVKNHILDVHRKWAHASAHDMRAILKKNYPLLYDQCLKLDVPISSEECVPCRMHSDTKKGKRVKPEGFGKVMSIDLHKLPCTSAEGDNWVLGIQDGYDARMRFIRGMKNKSDVVTVLLEFHAYVFAEYGVQIARFDGDNEFAKNKELRKALAKVRVDIHTHSPHTPHQTTVELGFRHILRRAREISMDMSAHTQHFAHAMSFVADTMRMTPRSNGEVPEVAHCATSDHAKRMEAKVKSRIPRGPWYSTVAFKPSQAQSATQLSGKREPNMFLSTFLGYKHDSHGLYVHYWDVSHHMRHHLACVNPAACTFVDTSMRHATLTTIPTDFRSQAIGVEREGGDGMFDINTGAKVVEDQGTDVDDDAGQDTATGAEEGDDGERKTADSLIPPPEHQAQFSPSQREEQARQNEHMHTLMSTFRVQPGARVNHVMGVLGEKGECTSMHVVDESACMFAHVSSVACEDNASEEAPDESESASEKSAEPLPKGVKVAAQSEAWRSAMERELQGILEHCTESSELAYEKVKKKDNSIIIMDTTWAFAHRVGKQFVEKARLCARGDKTAETVESSYAGSIAREYVRAQIAIAASNPSYTIVLGDCKQAYLTIKRTEVGAPRMFIRVRQPARGEDGEWYLQARVYEILCVLYGERMGSAYFQRGLVDHLRGGQMEQSKVDTCAFHSVSDSIYGGPVSVCCTYDDLLFIGCESAIRKLFLYVQHKFQLLECDLSHYLGLNVSMTDSVVHVCQRDFVKRILSNEVLTKAFEGNEIKGMKKKDTPISQTLHAPVWTLDEVLHPEGVELLEDSKAEVYRSVVGAALYLNWTRPDTKVAVAQLARHMARPTSEAWAALKRLLCYLKGTVDLGLAYPREDAKGEYRMEMYVDASHASQVSRTSTKSVSGFVILLNGAVISFHTGKQSLTAVSSTESEVLALCDGILELRGVTACVEDLLAVHGGTLVGTDIFCDNTSAITLCRDRTNCTGKTRHFAIRQSICREYLEGGERHLSYIRTEDQVADLFTKPLAAPAFKKLTASVVCKAPGK